MKFKIDLVLKLNQKQTAKIRKEETNRKTERECSPGQPTWHVHLAAQPTRGTAVFNLCLLAEACQRARDRRGHLPVCFLLSRPFSRRQEMWTKPRTDPLLLWSLSPFSPLDLELGRTSSSPPSTATAAAGPPSPPRLVQRVRSVALITYAEPSYAGCPASPATSSSSTAGTRDRHRRLALSRPSPAMLSAPGDSP